MGNDWMKVVVSRVWNDVEVTSYVSAEEIGVKVDLDDFIRVLLLEAGVEEEMSQKLLVSIRAVLTKLKRETAKVAL